MRTALRFGRRATLSGLAAAFALGAPSACAAGGTAPEGAPSATEIVAPDSLAARWARALDSPDRPIEGLTWVGWSVEHPRVGIVMSNTGHADLRGAPSGSASTDPSPSVRSEARDALGETADRPGDR